MDGQLREIDKPFEVSGYEALYPGAFGVASEDIHCRCCLLQRASWAVSTEVFYDKWNGDKNELVKVEAKTYNEFKETVKTILDKQEHPKFVPAKSLEEAEQFARSLGMQCSYKDIDLQVANDMNAAFWGGDIASFLKALEDDVKSQWHPEGCNTVSSVFDHEIGHQIDYAVGLRTNKELMELWSSLSRSEIKEGLSSYGAENIAEFIAEGYAEYCNNPKPRELAMKIGQIIEKAVKVND